MKRNPKHNGRIVIRLLIALALLVALPALSTAQRRGGGGGGGGNRGGAPRSNQPPRANRSNNPQNQGNNQAITITKTDGTQMKVELLSYDVDHLQVRNPGERGDFVPIDVSWNDVKTVSDPKITYEKVLTQWKALHRNELCPTCHGNRVVLCDVCRGTYHDPSVLPMDCPTCGGALLVQCKGPKCMAGKIPCTNVNCMKLTDGQWVERDNDKAKSLKWNGGVTWVNAKKYLGHDVVIDQRTGTISDRGVCGVCGGATVLECPVCDGLGLTPCQACSARKVALCYSDCDKGKTICPTCGGNGLRRPTIALAPTAQRFSRETLATLAADLRIPSHTPVAPISSDGELLHSVVD